MTCSNCGARLSCGCQRKTASDGKACCSNCISFYEKGLTSKPTTTTTTGSPTLTVQKNVWGANRYVNTIKK
jgi:hypothetical protein